MSLKTLFDSYDVPPISYRTLTFASAAASGFTTAFFWMIFDHEELLSIDLLRNELACA
jgi:hypothetical protein